MNEDIYKDFYATLEAYKTDPFSLSVKQAFDWFVEFIGQEEWAVRKGKVVQYFQNMNQSIYKKNDGEAIKKGKNRIAMYEDWISWYMYLAEAVTDKPQVSEPNQSSRVFPFFAMIGDYRTELEAISGIEGKLQDLLTKNINQPDSVLFEMVVAICYVRNGWEVEFIPETRAHKTPDLLVKKGDETYYVECKRLGKVTEYSENERNEWLKRWNLLVPTFFHYPDSTFIEVTFKQEVAKTNPNLLSKAFLDMAQCGAISKGVCVENDEIKVCAKHIDMRRVEEHFDNWMVKYPSAQFYELFDDEYVPYGSYTIAGEINLVEVGEEGDVINIFADKVGKVFCARWQCIADASIDKKAKDVKKLLSKAVKQAPNDFPTVIHIGYETLHGPEIEIIRDQKITSLISEFEFGDQSVASVFCHSFQPRYFADGNWDFAETTRYYGIEMNPDAVLKENLLLQREGVETSNDSHWMQDLREYMN
ncbi:hypothetical protein [Moellerella wisconsensis]|uniref:hypothetical protein n=1 Tax=Moellerella wisconsensis TaxID=158849 RepID=UPI00240F0145|nr:hypothetical protein [Moellerella wisconsensis]